MESFSEALIEASLRQQMEHYGAEGLEEAIKRVYSENSKARETMLKVFYTKILKKKMFFF